MEKPAQALAGDLERAMQNKRPLHTGQQLLSLFHLDGKEKDGLTLADRLVGSSESSEPQFSDARNIMTTLALTSQLLGRVSQRIENESELEMVRNLITVAETQIQREGTICSMATQLYLTAGSNRPELVNPKIFRPLAIEAIKEILSAAEQRRGRVNGGEGVMFILMSPRRRSDRDSF